MATYDGSADSIELSKPFQGSTNELTRQVTVSMSPEQYERMFFQPTPPRGDLARRFGNPTIIGTMGFLVPFQTTVLCLLQWHGATPTSMAGISGTYYFLGGIAMNLAGLMEFILGNTFPSAVFIIYGCHWCNVAWGYDAVHNILAAFGANGAASVPYNSGQGMYNVTMALISFCFFLGSLRTNVPFALAVFCLIPLFSCIAAASFATGYATTEADAAHVLLLLKVGGGFGLVTSISGWWLAIELACASTGLWCPLPTLDLSQRFAVKTKAADLEAGGKGQ